jgi:hypothetical protein
LSLFIVGAAEGAGAGAGSVGAGSAGAGSAGAGSAAGEAVEPPGSCPKAIAAGKAIKTASTTRRSGSEDLNLDTILDYFSFSISAFTTARFDRLSIISIRALDSFPRKARATLTTFCTTPRIIG